MMPSYLWMARAGTGFVTFGNLSVLNIYFISFTYKLYINRKGETYIQPFNKNSLVKLNVNLNEILNLKITFTSKNQAIMLPSHTYIKLNPTLPSLTSFLLFIQLLSSSIMTDE